MTQTTPSPATTTELSTIEKDVHKAIYYNKWMFCPTWGPPGTGKTNFCMQVAQKHYHDWDLVLGCFFFQLGGLIHNLSTGTPIRVETRTLIKQSRVPVLIGDDWGAHGNKASTRTNPAFDILKGAWDTLRTKVGCIFITMNQTGAITQQIAAKYTHELQITDELDGNIGYAKYQKVSWLPDYRGYNTRIRKTLTSHFEFDVTKVPADVYREYDERRRALVDEQFVLMQDAIANTLTADVLRRIDNIDMELLELVQKHTKESIGISRKYFYKPENQALYERINGACARGLILSVRKKDLVCNKDTQSYYYVITPFGEDVIEAYNTLKQQ